MEVVRLLMRVVCGEMVFLGRRFLVMPLGRIRLAKAGRGAR